MPNDRKPPKKPYEVGYGRPPKATQFKPGNRAYRRAGPKKPPSLGSIFAEVMDEATIVIEDGQRRTRSSFDAIARLHVQDALKGDMRSFMAIIDLCRLAGLFDKAPPASNSGVLVVKRLPDERDGGAGAA